MANIDIGAISSSTSFDFSKLSVGFWICLGIFLAVSVAELYFCYVENEKWRKIIKPFCVGVLFIGTVMVVPRDWPIYIGLLFGVIGDIFLNFKHKVAPLVLGAGSFAVSHLLYVYAYMAICSPIPWHLFLLTGFVLIGGTIIAVPILRKAIKTPGIIFGGSLYFAIVALDLFWAVSSCFLGKMDFLFCNLLGMLSFAGSDAYLVKTLFLRNNKRRDFYIMATYLLAQSLITVGFVLTLVS